MHPEVFRKLAPADAAAINDRCGFITRTDLPKLATAWPCAQVLIRCQSFRCVVTADQAASAIEAMERADELRDASIVAGYWSRALRERANGAEYPPRTAHQQIVAMAEAERRHAADASTERLAGLSRYAAASYDTAARMLFDDGLTA